MNKQGAFRILTCIALVSMLTVAAAPAKPAAVIPAIGDGLQAETWGWDATCTDLNVGAAARITNEEDQPVGGVEVTFTRGADEKVVTTTEWGYAISTFPYEPGSGEQEIVISWPGGEATIEADGPKGCEGLSKDFRVYEPSCGYLYVDMYVDLAEDGLPAAGIEVTFTLGDSNQTVTTNEEGVAWASFPYEIGPDALYYSIDAGEWGFEEGEVSGPENCKAVEISVTASCEDGAHVATLKASWDGELGWLWFQSGLFEKLFEEPVFPFEYTFSAAPGTYPYIVSWWSSAGGWNYISGELVVPEECPSAEVRPNYWVHAYNLIKYLNVDPAKPPLLWRLFYIYVPPGYIAAWEPAVLKYCNSAGVKNADGSIYTCTPEMALKGYFKNLGVVDVEVNTVTGEVQSDDPNWPTSAYNRHWFGK